MFVITFGIAFGGLILCCIIAFALIKFVGLASQFTQICLYLLLVPALISFLLGLGLGNSAFHAECDRITENEERSEQADAGKPDPARS